MRIFLFIVLMFFCACGYTPMSLATSSNLDKEVSVKVIIDKKEPKNSIILGDNFTNYLKHYLHKTITSNAKMKIVLSLSYIYFEPLYYDELGYTKSYKTNLGLKFLVYKDEKLEHTITAEGEYIFNTNSISVISEEQKSLAIESASKKAFDEFALKLIQ